MARRGTLACLRLGLFAVAELATEIDRSRLAPVDGNQQSETVSLKWPRIGKELRLIRGFENHGLVA